jgi:hypothetical protein
MGWNSEHSQIFANRKIGAGDEVVYHLGRTYCPGAGWLVAWSIDQPDNTELTAVAAVAGAGSLSATVLENVDMSRHGLIAIPWPVLNLTVKADASTSNVVLHAYAIESAADLAGWPSQLYSTNLQNINAAASVSITIPIGATGYSVNGLEAHTVELKDQNGNVFDSYATQKGAVNIGQVTKQPARYTVDGGSVRITNDGAGAEDLVVRFHFDLHVGSSLA